MYNCILFTEDDCIEIEEPSSSAAEHAYQALRQTIIILFECCKLRGNDMLLFESFDGIDTRPVYDRVTAAAAHLLQLRVSIRTT